MKFSILLPTRNGGDFLENCIYSILNQNYKDFELVISDNANTDRTPDIIGKYLNDARVKVVRQNIPISVSENWTAALQASCGEYVLMMGDDDYLLPEALQKLDDAITRHSNPNCILYNGYSYVAPCSIGNEATSYWAQYHFNFGSEFDKEMTLDEVHRLDIVKDMFHFNQRIPLNMQTTLFSRKAIEKECRSAFQPPFPDHYLLNALMIAADRWVYLPDRLVVVGVSPKSFGHYFYSQNAADGISYLGISTDFYGRLPGNELLNGTCAWLLMLKSKYSDKLYDVEIDWCGYVRRQVYSWYLQSRYGSVGKSEFFSLIKSLSIANWICLFSSIFDKKSWQRIWGALRRNRKSQAETLWNNLSPLPGINNIRKFVEWLQQ